MRPIRVIAASLLLSMLASCTAPSPAPQAPVSSPAAPAPHAAASTSAAAPATATLSPPASDAGGPILAPAGEAGAPSRTCKVDADCAVKDVGSCCGTYPMCVNKDAKTNPAAVRAQCAKDGVASTCEVPQVGGCQCVKGQCANLANGTSVM